MTSAQPYIGVDIAKDWIDVFDPKTATAQRIATSRLAGFARRLRGCIVVFEASGGYERPLAEALAARKIPYARVNPRRRANLPAPRGGWPKPTGWTPKCWPKWARREDIKAMMRAENNRLKQARLACVARDIRSVLAHLARRLVRLEAGISAHVQAHKPLRDGAVRLQTMPGISPILSAALIAGLPELGSMDRRKIASLSGLAPHPIPAAADTSKVNAESGAAASISAAPSTSPPSSPADTTQP